MFNLVVVVSLFFFSQYEACCIDADGYPMRSLVLWLLCGWTRQTVRPIPCPMCRQSVHQFFKNIFACKVLSTFQGECLVSNATFTLDMAKDHVNNYPQMEMTCSHCNEKVKRGNTSLHSDRCVMKEGTAFVGWRSNIKTWMLIKRISAVGKRYHLWIVKTWLKG